MNREHTQTKQRLRCSTSIVMFGLGEKRVKCSLIAASMALAFAGPVLAKDAPRSPPPQEQTCVGFPSQPVRVAYSSSALASCCDGLACAQYLSTIVIPKPKIAHRT